MTSGLRIVVIGASSGIGRALTRALAGDGHRLLVGARRLDRLVDATEEGLLARYARLDVGREDEVAAFFAEVGVAFGGLDALVMCAGGYGPIGTADRVDAAAWWDAVRVNLFGTFLAARHAVALLRTSSRPRIVTFSGGGAFAPLPRYSAYAVSKAGVVRLTETLAQELASDGIAVNAVAPGFVDTEIHHATLAAGPEAAGAEFFAMTRDKLAAGALPMEVPVACVRFLLSPAADGLTGKTISAGFDPWTEPEFSTNVAAVNASNLYAMQRINLVHLPDGNLKTTLLTAAARRQAQAAKKSEPKP